MAGGWLGIYSYLLHMFWWLLRKWDWFYENVSTGDPWIMRVLGALTLYLHSRKSAYNFWLPQNVTSDSLLLTRSLADNVNSWLTYFVCHRKKMLLWKSKGRESTFTALYVFIEKKKKSVYKQTCPVKTHLVQGSAVCSRGLHYSVSVSNSLR